MAIVLAGPPIACGFCREAAPLEEGLARRAAELREKLSRVAGQQQQFVVRQQLAAETFDSWLTQLSSLLMWGLFGLLPAIFVGTRPEGLGFWEFLAGESSLITGDELVAKWWLYWACATGPVSIYAVQKIFGVIAARRLVKVVLPQPPLSPGAPPRCRCCNGELSSEGRVRRCEHCNTDHLVDGTHYQKADRTVAGMLDAMDGEISARNEGTDSAGFSLVMVMMVVGFFGPWVTAVVGALGFGAPRPVAWQITAIAAGVAAVAKLISLWVRFPDVPTVYTLQANDPIVVRGQRRQIVARISLSLTSIAEGTPILFLVGDDVHASCALMLDYDLNEHQLMAREYQLEVGGKPLAEGEDRDKFGDDRIERLDVHSAVDPRLDSRKWVSALCKQTGSSFRLWLDPPSVGQSPMFTLRPGETLEAGEVFLPGVGREVG